MKYPLVVKLGQALEADGILSSFTQHPGLEHDMFYVWVGEPKISWRGIEVRKLEKLIGTVPIEKAPTLIGTGWMFEDCHTTQFFLKLRLKYGI